MSRYFTSYAEMLGKKTWKNTGTHASVWVPSRRTGDSSSLMICSDRVSGKGDRLSVVHETVEKSGYTSTSTLYSTLDKHITGLELFMAAFFLAVYHCENGCDKSYSISIAMDTAISKLRAGGNTIALSDAVSGERSSGKSIMRQLSA